tara:strand:- start:382 stop:1566 length:1185 start_codon:yes stop_codon:yes gene_type:complete
MKQRSKKFLKKKILCFIEHYLPGHRFGGPVRTIANFVEYFGEDYEISIVCLDHDYLSNKFYNNKDFSKWHKIGKAKIFYIPKNVQGYKIIAKILKENSYALLYLNGIFSPLFTIFPLLLRKINLVPKNIQCVIAPRGMFSQNALKLKSIKKKIFLNLVKRIGLFNNIIFHASNNYEKKDIYRNLKYNKTKVFVAPNLTLTSTINLNEIKLKKREFLRLVFLSRIDPMKNLDFLLQCLLKVTNPIELSVYGNKQNENYYRQCLDLKEKLPNNIKVIFKGFIKNELIKKTLAKYDLFVLPSKGENFGHVILESLASGTPVLVSNKVFWQSDKKGGIQTLPLNKKKWTEAINNWSNFSYKILYKKKIAALNAAKKYNNESQALKKNEELLEYAFKVK